MPRKNEFELANTYCLEYYGRAIKDRDHMMRLSKFAPDIMNNWLLFRQSTWKSIEGGGHISTKMKELIAIGVETATMKEHVGHVERAIDHGATVEEIAEVLGICIMLAGFESYMIGGRHVLKRAEEYAEKVKDTESRVKM